MSSIQQERPPEQEERMMMIPVFTVIKNGVILKNIFVVNNNNNMPSGLRSMTDHENGENPDQETDEILTVGRHPDCNIVLLHPSISRFHLQINSKPYLQRLFVTDLSSVHGTWVSEKKIDPGICVELKEGDTIRVGSSTRVYKLHWVPLTRAYDIDNPFTSPSDLAIIKDENVKRISPNQYLLATENQRDEVQDDESGFRGNAEYTYLDMNSVIIQNGEIESADPILEGSELVLADEDCESIKEMPSAPLMHENMDSSLHVDKEDMVWSSGNGDDELSLKTVGGVILQTLSQLFYECKRSSDCHSDVETARQQGKTCISMAKVELESRFEVCNLNSDHHSAMKAAPDEEHRNISMKRKELETNAETCSQIPDYHYARASVLEGEKADISAEKMDVHFNGERTSSSGPEGEANPTFETLEAAEIQGMLRKDKGQTGNLDSSNCNSPEVEVSETKNEQETKENQVLKPLIAVCSPYEEENQENFTDDQNSNLLEGQSTCANDAADFEKLKDKENQNSSIKFCKQHEFTGVCSLATECVNSSLPSKESQTPQSTFPAMENLENMESPPIRSEKRSSSCNMWSRRGKPATPLQIEMSKSRNKNMSVNIDTDGELKNHEEDESKSIRRVLFSGLEPMDEEEIFTPDKENHIPCTFSQKSLKSKGQLDDLQSPKSCRSSSKITGSPRTRLDEDMMASSDKENQTPKILQQMKSARPSRHKLEEGMVLKERRVERIPLQSLLANSPGKSLSETSVADAAARSISSSLNSTQKKVANSSTNFVGNGRRRWTMIADTTSLLEEESRRSLQLLQGLKGTHLVIPRMVIRELDSLKRRGSLFRSTTEADIALQWIEECMLKTTWWIHVQSSVEDTRLIAPTPPASPMSRFSEGSGGFPFGASSSSFSAYGNFLEIVSPTAEDHILDYALGCRKTMTDGQLVLVSNDIGLKIKAMAEGLICETAQEFRSSLVNPFSDRFLWAESSPRGQTWSVLDDVVLKEKYYKSPSKKSFKGEGAKGLKLILLHNSHYGQTVKKEK